MEPTTWQTSSAAALPGPVNLVQTQSDPSVLAPIKEHLHESSFTKQKPYACKNMNMA